MRQLHVVKGEMPSGYFHSAISQANKKPGEPGCDCYGCWSLKCKLLLAVCVAAPTGEAFRISHLHLYVSGIAVGARVTDQLGDNFGTVSHLEAGIKSTLAQSFKPTIPQLVAGDLMYEIVAVSQLYKAHTRS